DLYNNGGTPAHTVPSNSQFKCYDGMHNWNQVQPAPYDGMYSFPSVTSISPTTGKPAGTNCTACVPNPAVGWNNGLPMLPPGQYVVEMIVPPGYELVKEEDKNILIGDNYIAPVTQQFAGLGSIYILPDQATVSAVYNANQQTSALAKFWVFTSAHAAAHFTGIITDDFTSEFDPFSPTWGEKFSPANLPVAIKDWSGTEISRVYSDQWGNYDGLTYSTWEVNP